MLFLLCKTISSAEMSFARFPVVALFLRKRTVTTSSASQPSRACLTDQPQTAPSSFFNLLFFLYILESWVHRRIATPALRRQPCMPGPTRKPLPTPKPAFQLAPSSAHLTQLDGLTMPALPSPKLASKLFVLQWTLSLPGMGHAGSTCVSAWTLAISEDFISTQKGILTPQLLAAPLNNSPHGAALPKTTMWCVVFFLTSG